MNHGGARKGAGRKPTGSTQVILTVKVAPELLACLRADVPRGRRSSFVARAIADALRAQSS